MHLRKTDMMRKYINKRFISISDLKSPRYVALIRTICENHEEKISKSQALAILKFLQKFAELIVTQKVDSQ